MAETLDERVGDDVIASVDALNEHARSHVSRDLRVALASAEEALELAAAAGYDRGRAHALRTIGDCRYRLAEPESAGTSLAEAAGLFRTAGDPAGEADALNTLGALAYTCAEYEQALERFGRSLTLARSADERLAESNALNGLATTHYALGDYRRSAELYLESLGIKRQLGDRLTESGTLNNLGLVHLELGDYEAAASLHRESLAIKRELGDRQGEANALANLGVVLYRLGRNDEAKSLAEEALTLAREIGSRQTEAGCLENLGLVAAASGRLAVALGLHEASLEIQRELGNRLGEASALIQIGRVRARSDDLRGSTADLLSALELAESIRARRLVIEARESLAETSELAGELRAALEHGRAAAEAERALTHEQLERSTAALLAGARVEAALRQAELERWRTTELEEANEALERANAEVADLLDRLRGHQAELERLARTDAVTALANRRHFELALEARFTAARAHGVELAIGLLDIDHFKLVNDVAHSHRVGDSVLREMAAILQVFCREADIVARWGGAEFAILFPATTRADAAAACERIRRAVETHDWYSLHPSIRVTVSAGVAGSGEAASADDLVFVADARLYEAKEGGRNRVCW
jgi:diguanylate cyclase (GGDEF)-like protein